MTASRQNSKITERRKIMKKQTNAHARERAEAHAAEPSFRITGTAIDRRKRLETMLEESQKREEKILKCYARSVFYAPEIAQDMAECFMSELRAQRLIKRCM